ncbi:hypothetical protein AB1Y20_000157 [Prymnesium parvum]|uniref:GAF domain-containing protein n=1 Tax=Prymnesium parvum TaxID=97485 RepID=A0AB34K431_PRYPA
MVWVLALAAPSFVAAPLHAVLPPPPAAASFRSVPTPLLRAKPPPPPSGPPLPLLLQPEASLAMGLCLLLALVGNRLLTEDLLNSQSRADLLAAVAPVLLTLKGLTDLEIQEREAEAVELDGEEHSWMAGELSAQAARELAWGAETLLATVRCRSVAVWWDGRTVLLRGLLPLSTRQNPDDAVVPGPLVSKCMEKTSGAPEYLPSLQLLPGRVEFSYLPQATQSVLVLPMTTQGAARGVFVLGSDTQRAFKQDEVAWARAVSSRVGSVLSPI